MYLYNTRTKTKDLLTPLDPNHIRMYVCGPTVYDYAHIGNARPVVVFDVLYRFLKTQFDHVTYVRNITDVDDKINAAALDQKVPISTITDRTIKAYHADMGALNALPPTHEPTATSHIPQMISMIESLIAKNIAYAVDGHVLFDVTKDENYGHLSRRKKDELEAGARVEIAPYKKNPGDFVLWKPSNDTQPGWESPWGYGRPGWHIECSAMSKTYLGDVFDIHGGGVDLVFPHHENEVAQSCGANGTDMMANFWVHNGHLTVGGEKMSKSLGNFLVVRDLLKNFPGEAIRLALLSTHYRQPLDFNEKTLPSAKQTLDRFYNMLTGFEDVQAAKNIPADIQESLDDDLNTPKVISRCHTLLNEFYKATDKSQQIELIASFKAVMEMLGLMTMPVDVWFGRSDILGDTRQQIEKILNDRENARKQKDFSTSDQLRNLLLTDFNVVVEDTFQGPIWKKI
jgi:cysteinyl-tRNA synthetase